MNHLKIGVDIDNTLNDAFKDDNRFGEAFCKEKNHSYQYDPSKKNVKDRFQLTDDLYNEYMKRYFPINCKDGTIKPFAAEVVSRLQREYQIEFFIITARRDKYDEPQQPYKGWMMVKDTYQWLEKNGIKIPRENIFFSVKEKGAKCKELGIDILIDDDPKNIIDAYNHDILPFIMPYLYNYQYASYQGKRGIVLTYEWLDVYNILKEIAKEELAS